MHPVLFRIPLPGWTLPLFPTFLVVAALGLPIAWLGYQKKAFDLSLIGAAAVFGGVIAALKFRGEVYTLSALPVYSYGAMLCLSIVVGWYLTLGLGEKDGLPREAMATCYFLTALSAFVFARVFYVLTNLHEFHGFADVLNVRTGGLVAYGGFIGGLLGSWAFLRSRKLPLLPWADVAVPSLATGLFLTRMGCYLFGCDFGRPLSESAPGWLKKLGTFPRWEDVALGDGPPAFSQHVEKGLLGPDAEASLPVHPTQIYEAAVGLSLLGVLFLVRRHQRFRGQVFLTFAFGYGFLRFLIEIVRDDVERGLFGPHLAVHSMFGLTLLAFGAAYGFGPAQSLANKNVRRVTQVGALLPGAVAFVVLKPDSFAQASLVQLSTSQWLGLLTAVGAGLGWMVLEERARKRPDAAMHIELPPVEDEPEAREPVAPKQAQAEKVASPAPQQAEQAGPPAEAHPKSKKRKRKRRG